METKSGGLTLGVGTRLIHAKQDPSGNAIIALDGNEERLHALLSVVSKRAISTSALHSIKAALEYGRRGERALANIGLAQADLPRIHQIDGAYRLFAAEALLNRGTRPSDLIKEFGLNSNWKYGGQPHVPAGNGRTMGQWTSGHSAAVAPKAAGLTTKE